MNDHRPSEKRLFRTLSDGSGVQTSTLKLMIATGALPPIDAAIFADTQEEPDEVYRYREWLSCVVETSIQPFPLYRVTRGKLWDSATKVRTTRDGERTYIQTAVPVFTTEGLKRGMGQRHCTRDFKIVVVERQVRKLLGMPRIRPRDGVLVEMIMGITTDEADRMTTSRRSWIINSYPLIDLGMSRADCHQWVTDHGYPPPPRSACKACPFHNDDEWLALTPKEFQEAVEQEKQLQAAYAQTSELTAVPYLHESRVPLSQVVFNPASRHRNLDLFRNECTGFCGV